MRSTLLVSLGIALLSLALVSINTHVSLNYSLGSKPLTFLVPSTASGEIEIYQNSTNVTVYVQLGHGGASEVVKLPYLSALSPGNWSVEGYREVYITVVKKVVNLTQELKCGNVTTQRVVNQTLEEVSGKVTVPVYVKVDVTKVSLVDHGKEVEVAGISLIGLGAVWWVVERGRREEG